MTMNHFKPGDLIKADLFDALIDEFNAREVAVTVPDVITDSLGSAITAVKAVPLTVKHVLDVEGSELDPSALSTADKQRVVLVQMPAAGDRVARQRNVALLVTAAEKAETPTVTKPVITDVRLGRPKSPISKKSAKSSVKVGAKEVLSEDIFEHAGEKVAMDVWQDTLDFVTIYGSGFSANKQEDEVSINDETMSIDAASESRIVVSTPFLADLLKKLGYSSDQIKDLFLLDAEQQLSSPSRGRLAATSKYLLKLQTNPDRLKAALDKGDKARFISSGVFIIADETKGLLEKDFARIIVLVSVKSVDSDPYYIFVEQ